MGKIKKVCIVAPSLKIGGIGRVSSELANYWSGQGYEVVFICCLAGSNLYTLNPSIKLVEPKFRRTSSTLNKITFYPRIVSFIRKNVIANNPDVVLSMGDLINPFTLLALQFTNYPVFISDRTSPDYKYAFPNSQLKNIFYPKAAGFIAQTQKMKDYRQKQYPDLNIKVIPNPIKNLNFAAVNRKNVILYVGRFAIEKGPDRLIKAFAEVKHNDKWILKMAGDGPMLEDMKKLAAQLKVNDRIEFLGQVDGVVKLYEEASIFVLPSRLEGFPNALCEAMNSGLPCVTFDSIPYKDVYTPGVSGLVVNDNDIKGLAVCLDELIEKPELREKIGYNAKEEMKKLSLSSIAGQFAQYMNV